VKYEEVYIKDYANVPEAIGELGKYFGYYNTQRPHQALGYRTPEKVFFGQWKLRRFYAYKKDRKEKRKERELKDLL
jgi:hypothetical protein